MNSKIFLYLIIMFILISSTAFAHDAKFHKGKPIEGKVSAVEATTFKIQSDKEVISVQITADTILELGTEGQKASVQDLKDGASVMVFGLRLESGILVAKEVIIHSDTESDEDGEHEH